MTQEQRETLVEVCARLYSYRHLMELSEKEQDFLDITIQLLDGVLDFDGINEHEIAPSITTQAHTDWNINASDTYTTGHIDIDRFKKEIADYTDESGYVAIPLSILLNTLNEVAE